MIAKIIMKQTKRRRSLKSNLKQICSTISRVPTRIDTLVQMFVIIVIFTQSIIAHAQVSLAENASNDANMVNRSNISPNISSYLENDRLSTEKMSTVIPTNTVSVLQAYIKQIHDSPINASDDFYMTNISDVANIDAATASPSSLPPRIYLQKGNLQDVYLEVNDESHQPKQRDTKRQTSNVPNDSHHNNRVQTSIQIHIIFFIGLMPAAIGAFVWWIKNMYRQCSTHSDRKRYSSYCSDVEKLSSNHLMQRSAGQGKSIDGLAYQIARRAEKVSPILGDDAAAHENSYRSKFIKSRRVYTLEMPRKCLEMIEILGEGNFGQVWKAKSYQIAGGRPMFVAVKTNKVNANVEQQEDLLKELDIMLQLGSHPNVVRLLGCCTENEPYYLVMEYIAQGKLLSYLRHHRKDGSYYLEPQTGTVPPLSTLIQNNNYVTYCHHNNAYRYREINPHHKSTTSLTDSLSANDLMQFAYQIAKGMEFISSHGIIHRDLASRNVLIEVCGTNKICKVADFGLSRSVRDKDDDSYEMRHAGQLPIRWMSPEALAMGVFTASSDVWAFGVLVWEIVTLGSTPYVGMGAQEVISFVRQGNICPQPKHCSDELYDLMKSCWAYRAEDRFTFTRIKTRLAKMLLAESETDDRTTSYIDLEHFNNSLYYYDTNGSPNEKL